MNKFKEIIKEYSIYFIFFFSFISVTGSLYYSEIEKEIPCPFCWWQRLFMYPILIIVIIALTTKDRMIEKYTLALASIGALFALYHSLLQSTDLFTESESCIANGTSCATIDIAWDILGFQFTMPMASFLAFAGIVAVSGLKLYFERKK